MHAFTSREGQSVPRFARGLALKHTMLSVPPYKTFPIFYLYFPEVDGPLCVPHQSRTFVGSVSAFTLTLLPAVVLALLPIRLLFLCCP